MIHLTVSSKCAPEGTFDGASKNALRDLHKGTEKGALEVALKGALEVALVDAMINEQMCTDQFM